MLTTWCGWAFRKQLNGIPTEWVADWRHWLYGVTGQRCAARPDHACGLLVACQISNCRPTRPSTGVTAA